MRRIGHGLVLLSLLLQSAAFGWQALPAAGSGHADSVAQHAAPEATAGEKAAPCHRQNAGADAASVNAGEPGHDCCDGSACSPWCALACAAVMAPPSVSTAAVDGPSQSPLARRPLPVMSATLEAPFRPPIVLH